MPVEYASTVSLLALGVSIVSIWVTHNSWMRSNRPIVSAYIEEASLGDGVVTFNLQISNTGTRPATNVRIYIDGAELEKILDVKASPKARMELASCFAWDSRIPLIRNGETLTGGLGRTSRVGAAEPQLMYGGEAKINILYSDLDGKSYISKLPIKVYARSGFTGRSWQSAA